MKFDFERENNYQYVVKQGDSLYKIAKDYGVSVNDLLNVNGLKSALIYPNQVLIIPLNNNGEIYFVEYVVKDTLSSLPLSYTVNVIDRVAPVISLKDSSRIKISVGEELDMKKLLASVVASDNYGDVEVVYAWESVFNNYEAGEYVVNFYAVDESGNKSEIVSRIVQVGATLDLTSIFIIVGVIMLTGVIMVGAVMAERRKKRVVKSN